MTRERAAELLSEVMVLDDSEMAEAHRVAISALRQQDVTDKYVGKMTNAQKIRAMNDEELAEFLADAAADYCHVGLCKDGETCRICCLNWLQMPAEEDDHV